MYKLRLFLGTLVLASCLGTLAGDGGRKNEFWNLLKSSSWKERVGIGFALITGRTWFISPDEELLNAVPVPKIDKAVLPPMQATDQQIASKIVHLRAPIALSNKQATPIPALAHADLYKERQRLYQASRKSAEFSALGRIVYQGSEGESPFEIIMGQDYSGLSDVEDVSLANKGLVRKSKVRKDK